MAAQSGLSIVDPSELGRILAALDTLARQTGASTLTICHSPMSDQNKVAGSYPIMGNPDLVLQAVRGEGLTTRLRSVKTRDRSDVEPLILTLRSQDVQQWLAASYAVEQRPVPATLEVSDFDDLTPGANTEERIAGDGPPRLTSLVVASGMSVAAAAASATAAADERARQDICRLLAATPDGLGQRAIRETVKLRDEKVAALLADLQAEGVVMVALQGSGRTAKRVYRLQKPHAPLAQLPPKAA